MRFTGLTENREGDFWQHDTNNIHSLSLKTRCWVIKDGCVHSNYVGSRKIYVPFQQEFLDHMMVFELLLKNQRTYGVVGK